MTKNQNIGEGKRQDVRFKRPAYAAPFVVGNRETFNELINLINQGSNSNIYLNNSFNKSPCNNAYNEVYTSNIY